MQATTHAIPHVGVHEAHHEETGFWRKYIFSIDHKIIGIQYAMTALSFLLFGFCLMLCMRWSIAEGAKMALTVGYTPKPIPIVGHLLELLLGKGYQVFGVIRRSSVFTTERIDHLYQDRHEKDVRFRLLYGDMLDPMGLRRILSEAQPDHLHSPALKVPREPVLGGPLAPLGINFASNSLGNYLSELNAFNTQVAGFALGYQAFWDNHRRNIVFELAGVKDTTRGFFNTDGRGGDGAGFAVQFQQAIGQHVQFQLDGFVSYLEGRTNGSGARAEILVQF